MIDPDVLKLQFFRNRVGDVGERDCWIQSSDMDAAKKEALLTLEARHKLRKPKGENPTQAHLLDGDERVIARFRMVNNEACETDASGQNVIPR